VQAPQLNSQAVLKRTIRGLAPMVAAGQHHGCLFVVQLFKEEIVLVRSEPFLYLDNHSIFH
jgi:hypothetical protein